MKKKILISAMFMSCLGFSAIKPNGKQVRLISKEVLVSQRLENKTDVNKNEETTGNQNEKGDADIIDTVPKKDINLNLKYPFSYTNYRMRNNKVALLNNILGKLENISYSYLNVPYLWGGTTRRGLDCSAFVKNSYGELGIVLPRVSRDQAKVGKTINSIVAARKGDLMFFYTDSSRPNTVTHVGMYLGNNKMIHASSSNHKVVVVNITDGYFMNKMAGIKRIVDINS